MVFNATFNNISVYCGVFLNNYGSAFWYNFYVYGKLNRRLSISLSSEENDLVFLSECLYPCPIFTAVWYKNESRNDRFIQQTWIMSSADTGREKVNI